MKLLKTSELSSNQAAVALVVGCIVFGLGSLIVKWVDVGSYALAFWRLAVASVVFRLWLWRQGLSTLSARGALSAACAAGVFLGIDLAFWHESVRVVGPGISTVLNSLQIFFLVFISMVFLRERQNYLRLFALLVAILGVVLMGLPEWQHTPNAAYGLAIGIASGAMLALSMTMIQKAHRRQKIALPVLMYWVSLGGAVILLPPALWWDVGHFFPKTLLSWGWIAVYGVVMQCMAWGLIAYSVRYLSLSMTGFLLLAEPVAALLLDLWLLHKQIIAMQWLGITLTLVAIFLGSVPPATLRRAWQQWQRQ